MTNELPRAEELVTSEGFMTCAAKSGLKLLFAFTALALFLCLSQRTALAQGGPPMLTDDPDTPGNNHWEINTAFTLEKEQGEKDFAAPFVDINYGVGRSLQLKVEVPYHLMWEGGQRARAGFGSVNFGVKWRFLEAERHGFAVSTYPQFEYKPAAAVRRGTAEPGNELLLPLEVTRKAGPVDVNVEVGYRIRQLFRDELLYGVAVGRDVTKRLELAAEVHGEPKRGFRDDDRIVNFGARYRLTKHYTFLFSAGRSLRAAREGVPSLVMYAGLQFTH